MAGRPPGHPPARGCFSARNPSDPLGRCRFYELPWNRVTSTRTPAARRVPPHRRTSECTCSIPTHRHGRHDVHAGPITTDTDIGPSRTYGQETRNEYERAYALHHVADAYSSFFISYRHPFVRESIFHEKTYRIHRKQHGWKFLTIAGIAVFHFQLLEKYRIVPCSLLVHFAVRSSSNNVPVL